DFLTSTSVIATRGCHSRCGFCYLSTGGLHMPYQLRDPEQVAAEILADGRPYAVFVDNNLGSRPDYLRQLCRALRPIERIWRAPPSGWRRTHSNARPSTYSPPTPGRPCSGSSRPRAVCCIATGRSTTPRTWCSGPAT